jgi:hypothetical protein
MPKEGSRSSIQGAAPAGAQFSWDLGASLSCVLQPLERQQGPKLLKLNRLLLSYALRWVFAHFV